MKDNKSKKSVKETAKKEPVSFNILYPDKPAYAEGFGPDFNLVNFSRISVPHKIAGTLSLLAAVCIVAASATFIFTANNLPIQDIKTAIISQEKIVTLKNNSIIAGGQPVAWTVLIKRSDINSGQYLLKLPKSVKNINITSVTFQQAKEILSSKPQEQLSLAQKKQIASSSSKQSLFVASIFNSIGRFFISSVEDGVEAVIDAIDSSTQETPIQETPEATIVDLSSQALAEEAPTESLPESSNQTEEPIAEVAPEEAPAPSTESAIVETPVTTEAPTESLPEATNEYVKINYETPAPEIIEQDTDKGKLVTVSSANVEAIDCETLNPANNNNILSFFSKKNLVAGIFDGFANTIESIKKFFAAGLKNSADQKKDKAEAKQEKKDKEAPIESLPESSNQTEEPIAEVAPEEAPTPSTEPAIVETPITTEAPAESLSETPVETSAVETPAINQEEASSVEATAAEAAYQDCLASQTPLTNVLAFTNIPEIYKVGQEDGIKVKWKNPDCSAIEDPRQAEACRDNGEISFHAYDTDNNGKLDYVEWTVPHLSEQIFEIIFISKAFQLDENQNILADIYDTVSTQDGDYATITNGQYIRYTFEKTLDNTKDNTIYAKPVDPNQPARAEIYPVYTDADGNMIEGPIVEVFENIDHDGIYKVFLTNLQEPTDTFDLKIIGGDVEVDYIVDPATSQGPNNPSSAENNSSVGSVAWNNPTAVYADDYYPSDVQLGDGEITYCSNYNCGIYDNYVSIVKGGTISSTNYAGIDEWSENPNYYTYGSSSSLWGESWTAEDINSSGFGVAISAYAYNFGSQNDSSYYLKATNFGFGIPSGAIIDGITVEIKKYEYFMGQPPFYQNEYGYAAVEHIRITVNYTANGAPYITSDPTDSSDIVNPTTVGSNVAFEVTAVDPESNNYYLAVCKTGSVTANSNAAPTCDDGEWCISSSTATGTSAYCYYETDNYDNQSNDWYAFVCDYNSYSACSSYSYGYSPFNVAVTRYWTGVGSGYTGYWSDTNNWAYTSGGGGGADAPTGAATAVFDGAGGYGYVGGVRLNSNISLKSIQATSGFNGGQTYDGAIIKESGYSVTVSDDVTLDNKAIYLTDNSWTIDGDFDFYDVSTLDAGTSTVYMTENSSSIIANGQTLYDLYINGSTTVYVPGSSSSLLVEDALIIGTSATFSIDTGKTVYAKNLTMADYSTLTGNGTFNKPYTNTTGTLSRATGTTINITTFQWDCGGSLTAGEYSSANTIFYNGQAENCYLYFLAGTHTFTGNVTFQNAGSGFLNIGNFNNPDFVFKKDVSFIQSAGSLSWNKGTGTITLGDNASNGTQTINFNGAIVEDIIVNASGDTKSLAANVTTDSLTITAGTLNANGQTLTSTGLTTVQGGTYQPSTATQTLTGGLTFTSGTITQSTGTINIAGNVTISGGTFTKNASGLIVFKSGTANQQLTSGGKDLGNIQISANTTNTTLTLQDALNTDNITIDASQTLDVKNGGNYAIAAGGNWANSGTFTARAGTVTFDAGSGTQTLNGGSSSFYNLTHSGAGTLQPTTNHITITGALTLNAGAGTFDNATNDKNITVTGNVTMDSTRVDLGDGTWTVGGDFDFRHVTTWNKNSSTIVLTGSGKNLLTNSVLAFNNLTIASGASYTYPTTSSNYSGVLGVLAIDGTFTMGSGMMFNCYSCFVDISATGSITGSAGYFRFSIQAAGRGLRTYAGTMTPGTLMIQAAVSGTVFASGTFGTTLAIDNSQTATNSVLTFNGNYVITGDLTITRNHATASLTIDNSTYNPNIEVQGSVSIVETTGAVTWTKGTGILTFSADAAGTETINFLGKSVEDIVINATGDTKNLTSSGVTTDSLTVTAGTFGANGQTLAVTGLTTVQGGTYQPSTAAQTLTGGLTMTSGVITQSTGTITVKGDTTISGGTFTKNASGLMVFASGDANQDLTSGGADMGNIQVSANTTNTTLTLQDNLNADNITIDSSQTLDVKNGGNYAIAAGGNWANSGTFTARAGTVTFDAGSGTQTLNGGSSSFYNLTHSGAGALQLATNNLTATGNLTNSAGTLDSNGKDITVAGNWSNSATFTQGTRTVTLNGTNQKILGATTFYNLTKDISAASAAYLYLQQSNTQTIAANGTLTLTGGSGKILTLRGCDADGNLTSGDPKWGLNVNNTGTTVTVDYVDVKDSDASAGKQITLVSIPNSTNSGNNLNWLFNVDPNAPTLVSPANASSTADTTPTLSANYSDSDTGDTGTTNYRISSSGLADCVNNTNVIAWGTSSETASNNEDTTWTNGSSIGGDATYYWCAQNNDGIATSSWTQMGSFTIDTAPPLPTVTALGDDSSSPWSTKDTNPLIVISLNEEGSCRVSTQDLSYDGMTSSAQCSGSGTTTASYRLANQNADTKTVYISCADSLGNANSANDNTELFFTIESSGGGFVGSPAETPLAQAPAQQPTLTPQPQTNILDQIGQQIIKVIGQIPGLPKPGPEIIYPPIAESVPQETPSALQDLEILSVNPLESFNLRTIKSDIAFFADRVPQLEKTLDALAVNPYAPNDVKKIADSQFYLPGLTEIVLDKKDVVQLEKPGDLVKPEMAINKFASVQGVPLEKLSANVINRIPSNMVFARTAGELIDFNTALNIDKHGNVEQTIKMIAGKPIQLIIKPDKPAKNVTGLITLTKVAKAEPNPVSGNVLTRILAAAISVSPMGSFGSAPSTSTPSSLLVSKFDYLEIQPNVFKAEISAPAQAGAYKIATVVEYKDEDIQPMQTNLTAQVEPEGYIYSQTAEGRVRIQNARVSIYWLNPDTQKYELWSGDNFLQKNPVYTDETGRYSFLVPQGNYYLAVLADKYLDYKSEPFDVAQEIGVRLEIELKKKTILPNWLSWQMIIAILLLIIIIMMAVVIIFYLKNQRSRKI